MLETHWLAVITGGALGAILRAKIYELFTLTKNVYLYPLPTLVVNLIGSLIIGISWHLLIEKSLLSSSWKIFIMTGFTGAFTTFSTFSLDIFRLLQNKNFLLAISYIITNIIFCLLATTLGYYSSRWLFK
jgi:CrcB protein